MRVGLGPGVLMSYILQGLVHPARKVREVRQTKDTRLSESKLIVFVSRSTGGSTIRAIWAHKMPWSLITLILVI